MVRLQIALCCLVLALITAGISCGETGEFHWTCVPSPAEAGGAGGSGNASTGGAGGAGGQGGTGGSAALPECRPETVADDCGHLGAPDPRCGSLQCIEDKCVLEIKTGPTESQKYGDCRQVLCDVAGNLIEVDDDADFYNDGNQCTLDFCLNGAAHFTLPDGNQCPEFGEGYCYQGACVECIDILPQANCKNPGQVCDQVYCEDFTPQCAGTCGGNCAPCAAGGACVNAADCQSGVCTNGMCQFPTCNDGVKNDGETGTDCGAQVPDCPLCLAGEGCKSASNCESGVCMIGICQAPSCTDGTQNGDEAGIDCGGSCSAPCVGQ